jgi:cleavage and polyadenylation specificity factor subunit 3
MMRLKSKLLSLNAHKTEKVKVFSPKNCEELRIPFKTDKTAKVVGKLASIPQPMKMPKDGNSTQEPQLITGVLVQNDFKMSLMAPEDLREYAGLTTTTIACKQRLKLSAAGIDLIKWGLEGTFGSIEELPETKMRHQNGSNGDSVANGKMEEDADEELPFDEVVAAYLVMGCVTVRYRSNGEVELEWEGNMLNDGIADAVMAVLLGIESSPAAVKREPFPCCPYIHPALDKALT